MRVNNFSEFYSLLKRMNLQSVSPYNNFINCVDVYMHMCNCGNLRERAIKKQQAVNQYISLSKGVFSQHAKSVSPIFFYNDSKLIIKY